MYQLERHSMIASFFDQLIILIMKVSLLLLKPAEGLLSFLFDRAVEKFSDMLEYIQKHGDDDNFDMPLFMILHIFVGSTYFLKLSLGMVVTTMQNTLDKISQYGLGNSSNDTTASPASSSDEERPLLAGI